MEDHVYRIIEISGSSQTSIEDAIQTAVSRAGRTLRNLPWFEVLQTRGHLEGGQIQHYQVVLKIGFTIDDSTIGAGADREARYGESRSRGARRGARSRARPLRSL